MVLKMITIQNFKKKLTNEATSKPIQKEIIF